MKSYLNGEEWPLIEILEDTVNNCERFWIEIEHVESVSK
jgi:hypothetical protein